MFKSAMFIQADRIEPGQESTLFYRMTGCTFTEGNTSKNQILRFPFFEMYRVGIPRGLCRFVVRGPFEPKQPGCSETAGLLLRLRLLMSYCRRCSESGSPLRSLRRSKQPPEADCKNVLLLRQLIEQFLRHCLGLALGDVNGHPAGLDGQVAFHFYRTG